ncbi:hypothetical protein [Clostridium rectalis]|uniref:hypothetical protein n=1 Tax=Clostridium rectalis TaxID=2040295 RepID=UPI000F63CED0|nr:hypothetical protein [Clostridium rectalis]
MSNRYLKKENETDFEYGLRLIEIKCEENPQDLDWQSIIDYLNLNIHRDSLRKACNTTEFSSYNVMKYFKNKMKNNIKDDDILNEIEMKKIELEEERKKKQTISIEYNKILREKSRNDLLFEELQKSIGRVNVPEFKPIIKENNSPKEGVVVLADEHFGKIFSSLNNNYSEDIFYQRMNQITEEILNVCNEQKLNHIHILNLGDNIEGMCLRVSQLMSLQMGMTDMVIRYARYMVNFLNELSKHIEITYHHSYTGNHSQIRPLGTKADMFPKENMERVVFMYIKDMLSENNRIIIPEYEDGNIKLDIFGYKIFGKHKIKNIEKAIQNLSMQYRTFIDYLYLGHLHHKMNKTVMNGINNNCEIIITPSIMGSDDYSDDLLTGSKAGIIFDIFQEGRGRRITYDIILN